MEGAHLALIDITESVFELQKELATDFPQQQIRAYVSDISSETSVVEVIKGIVSDFKRIDVLINNAATKTSDLKTFFKPFESYRLETWREVMSVNIDGMFLLCREVGKHMVSAGISGSIIQFSSIYGINGPDQRIYEGIEHQGTAINTPAVYSASKSAVVGLSKFLATYWGDKNIRVNTITPGGVDNEHNDNFRQNYSMRVPMGRMGTPKEIAKPLVFLASDESSYITGQNIVVDGGLSSW